MLKLNLNEKTYAARNHLSTNNEKKKQWNSFLGQNYTFYPDRAPAFRYVLGKFHYKYESSAIVKHTRVLCNR